MLIGIIDAKVLKNEKSSRKAKSAFSYYSNGYKCPEDAREGDGFKAGNVLETVVDLAVGKIEWRVHG